MAGRSNSPERSGDHGADGRSTRRVFLKALGRGAGAAALLGGLARGAGASPPGGLPAPAGRGTAAEPAAARKKVALLATEVRKYSHAQHFIDRLLEGYGWEGKHRLPPLELASLYVDQIPEGDLSAERARRHGVKIYPTIAESLTLGGSSLAVDGVLIIGEHGRYPKNEKGQKLYPRYRFFQETVQVFESSGRSAPVFNDKHLSTEWRECKQMVEDSRRLGFAFLAGSSLPVTWRIPSLEIEAGTQLEESLCACYGGVDAYDIHGLETAQCMSERRSGGECGVRSVHAVRGAKVWSLLAGRPRTADLLLAALSRSHTLSPPPGYSFAIPGLDQARAACPEPVAYFIEHLDGFLTTLLLLNGLVQDFTWAGRVKGSGRLLSCQFYLPMPPAQTTLANFFSPLMLNIEETFLSGKEAYPVERTLLTSGMVIFAVESLYRGEVPLLTPELKIAYPPPARSTFWRS